MFHSNIEDHGVVAHDRLKLPHFCPETGAVEPDILHIIIPYSNYSNFKARLNLHRLCRENLKNIPGIKVWIVEVALGDRPFVVTEENNLQHIQLRTRDILWHKESMINVGIRHLSALEPNWKYVAWVDGDVQFQNKNVAYKTISQLQTYSVVQMFSSVVNLGPNGEVHSTHYSFCYQYAKNGYVYRKPGKGYAQWHPGFAWACTRKAYTDMGGLIDRAILGSADHHMATAFVGQALKTVNGKCSKGYKRMIKHWQKRVMRTIQGNIGFVEGTIIHGWHGDFKLRRYVDRWQILIECDFNPETDVKMDDQGLIVFDKPKHRLRDLVRHYFDQRNEDSIEK